MRLTMIQNAAQFKRVRGGTRFSSNAFVIEAKMRVPPADDQSAAPRFGLIVTKKLGGAVDRNRIRRRIKEALRSTAGGLARPQVDYVILARRAAYDVAFADLEQAFRQAFVYLHGNTARGGSGRRKGKPRDIASPADGQSKRRQPSE